MTTATALRLGLKPSRVRAAQESIKTQRRRRRRWQRHGEH